MQPNGQPAAYTCTLHESAMEVAEEDWSLIVDESRDLAMDRALIAAQEETLANQCRMWTAIIRDAAGVPAACAVLCLFKVDALVSAPGLVRRAVSIGRRAMPDLLRNGVLFCGLPIPAGASHLRLHATADSGGVLACLHNAMDGLARRHRASLMVFKEFEAQRLNGEHRLVDLGYLLGDIPPMHRLTAPFADFDEYLASMRSRYRAEVQRSLRKIRSGAFRVEHHLGGDAVTRNYTDAMHHLYERVWRRSRYQLERLTPEFFRAAARAAPDDVALSVIRRRSCGTPVGFTFSIARGVTWHNLYSGVDYSVNGEGDILFNLFYADLALAMSRGCTDIRLGQTGDAFKTRLGANSQPLKFFVRARSPVIQAGMRALSDLLFPSLDSPIRARVFRTRPAPQSARPATRRALSQPADPNQRPGQSTTHPSGAHESADRYSHASAS